MEKYIREDWTWEYEKTRMKIMQCDNVKMCAELWREHGLPQQCDFVRI